MGILTDAWPRDDGARVGRITVDNQAKINILNSAMSRELRSAIATLREDPALRAIVLTGAGDRAFIGGADIAEMATLTLETAREFISVLHQVCQAIRDAPVPVIARIEGYCLGGGLEVAAACDLRVAAHGSMYGMPEVRVGIPSVIEAALLPRLIGWGKTRELLYTGAMIDAEQAVECGLINKLVAAGDLDDAVNRWLDGIVSAGPRAIRLQKELMSKWESLPLDRAIQAGIDSFASAYETDEPNDRMRQFLNRSR